jgi:mannose-6-phosphate isomerase-like protein (cupin superfamily)
MPFIEPGDMKAVEPLPGWKGRFWRSASMSFSHYDVPSGSSIHEHHHPNEEVWVIIEGRFEVTIGDETRLVGPGAVAVVPPDVPHSVRVREAGRAVIANHPIRNDLR